MPNPFRWLLGHGLDILTAALAGRVNRRLQDLEAEIAEVRVDTDKGLAMVRELYLGEPVG